MINRLVGMGGARLLEVFATHDVNSTKLLAISFSDGACFYKIFTANSAYQQVIIYSTKEGDSVDPIPAYVLSVDLSLSKRKLHQLAAAYDQRFGNSNM